MRRRSGSVILLAALTVLASASAVPQAETPSEVNPEGRPNPCPGSIYLDRTDRFEGGRTVILTAGNPKTFHSPSGDPSLSFTTLSKAPGSVLMTFEQTLVDWRYLKCASAAMLIDGKPGKSLVVSVDGEVWRDYVREKVRLALSGDLLKRLAVSEKVEYQLCGFEFEMTPQDLCCLRASAKFAFEFAPKKAPKKKR